MTALKPYGPVAGIVAGVALLQLANTVFSVLLPLALAIDGYPGTVAGIVATAYGAGFFAGCLVAHRLIRRVGHIRAFAVLAAACAILGSLFAAVDLVAVWALLRLAMGFSQAGLLTVVEGWLSAATEVRARGRVLAFYLVATKVAIVAGQLALAHLGAARQDWFHLAAAVFTAALIPVALTRTAPPPPPRLHLLGPRRLYRLAPAAMAGCFASGLLNSAVLGLVPVFGTRLGLATGVSVALLTAIQLGSLVLQWPLGRLSDRLDRRAVVAACAVAVAAASLAVALAGDQPALLLPLFALWGGVALSFYAVAVAHAADHAAPDEMVGVSSSSLLAWAAGSAIGPTLAAPFLDLVGPAGLFLYAAAVAAALAAFVLWRMTRRSPVPAAARDGFVNLPATSLRLADIDPRVPPAPLDGADRGRDVDGDDNGRGEAG